jgi:hypothetical protein
MVQVLKSQSDFGQMRHFQTRNCRFEVEKSSCIRLGQKPQQHGFLGIQAVLCLLEDN